MQSRTFAPLLKFMFMKRSYVSIAAVILMLLSSCGQKNVQDQLVGKWKIADVKIRMLDQMEQMGEMQIQMMQDSLNKATDTAQQHVIQSQLTEMQQSLASFKSQQDSSRKKTLWDFQKGGVFQTFDGSTTKTGSWSVNQPKMMLFTVLDNQKDSVDFKLESNTLTLQFDSANYMKLVKSE
jgi:hypothetical protein